MAMYRCADCGAVFADPELRERRENLDGYLGIWNYVYFVCPECKSDEVDEYWEDDDDAEED